MVLEPEGWALACILKSVAEEVVIKPECVRMCFCPTSEDTHSPSHANTQVAFNSRSPVPTTLLSVFDFIVFFQIASLSAFQQATSQWWWCFCPLSWCFWWRPLLLGFLIWVSYTYARQLQCVVFLSFHSYYLKVGYNVWHWEIQAYAFRNFRCKSDWSWRVSPSYLSSAKSYHIT